MALFRSVLDRPISTTIVDTLAMQRDSSKRIRDARKELAKEGIAVLGARYDNEKLKSLGYATLKKNHWIAKKLSKRQLIDLGLLPKT
jgi:hypothetical protein